MGSARSGDSGSASPIQAVDRALQILELLADNGPMGVTALATQLGVHRSTAFRLLGTLESRRFVTQETHRGTYALSTGALRIAGAVAIRTDFARESQLICDDVTARLSETSNVAILEDGAAVNIAQATGASSVAVRDQYVGQRTPLHATSSGKCLLAHADDAVFEEAARSMRRHTDATILDIDRLADEMAIVRAQGWGSALAEWQEHTNAVAVPVFATDRSVIAALSLTAPAFRMPEEELPDIAAALRPFADELSRRLGFLVPPRS
ncbi:IclR family transcriptional regulator [Pseudoclavibacter endophyticus]|nr:IclR family transcriptional regulator [Pseudoclavibacter endophyticus]